MEEDLNLITNGEGPNFYSSNERQTQSLSIGRRPQFFVIIKDNLIFINERWPNFFQMEDDLKKTQVKDDLNCLAWVRHSSATAC